MGCRDDVPANRLGKDREMGRPPRPELRSVADLLDESVQVYFTTRSGLPLGEWEAPIEGLSLTGVCIRNIKAAAILARDDELLAPAVWPNARNAFELATRVIWLLHPSDRFDSEVRWLALLQEYERFHERMASEPLTSVETGMNYVAIARQVRAFRLGVEARLPHGYVPQPRIPSVREMLKESGSEVMYRVYVQGSQYLHGSMVGSATFRKNLGTALQSGEFSKISDWILPLRVCWLSLRNAGGFVIDRLTGGSRKIDWSSVEPRIDAAFLALARCSVDEGSS